MAEELAKSLKVPVILGGHEHEIFIEDNAGSLIVTRAHVSRSLATNGKVPPIYLLLYIIYTYLMIYLKISGRKRSVFSLELR